MVSFTTIRNYVSQFDYLFFLEWVSTGILLTGTALTSLNVHPLNIYVSLVGNIGWLFVAIMWRKWSIITVQTVITVIYLFGMRSEEHTSELQSH